MKRPLIWFRGVVVAALAFVVLPHASATNWLVASRNGTLWDYTQGAAASSNPRNIPLVNNGIVAGIDFAADGQLYLLTTSADRSLRKVNPQTGAETLVGQTGLSNLIEGDLGFDPSTGNLYGLYTIATNNDFEFFRLDPTTGAATVIGAIAGDDLSGLAFDNSGQMWVIDSRVNLGGSPRLLQVDKSTGNIQNSMSTGLNIFTEALMGADFDPTTNQLYFAVGNGDFYHANTTTGLATLIGTHGVFLSSGLAFVPVPEPGSVILLFGFGVVLMIKRARRR